MTPCKIVEITPPPAVLTPAERTFTLTLTGQELQHLRASMASQKLCKYESVVGGDMMSFFGSLGTALQEADIPVLRYPGGLG